MHLAMTCFLLACCQKCSIVMVIFSICHRQKLAVNVIVMHSGTLVLVWGVLSGLAVGRSKQSVMAAAQVSSTH